MAKVDYFNSATVEDMAKMPHTKWQRDGKEVIPLWLASPDFKVAPEIKQALHDAVDADDVSYNSDQSCQKAIIEKLKRVNKIDAKLDQVILTQGVDPGIWLSIRHACKEGDEVITTNPVYAPLRNMITEAGAKPVFWNQSWEDGYLFHEEQLKKLVTKKTKMILLCNPHNPAGRVMTRDELQTVADIAVDKKIRVYVDELWEDIRFDSRPHISLASLNPEINALTSTSWGFSKTYGVAGLQLGYLYASDKAATETYKKLSSGIQRGTTGLSKAAAPVMLDKTLDWWRRDIIKHLTKIRNLCVRRMNKIPGVNFPKVEGTYMPFPRFDYNKSSKELNEYLLKEAKVALSVGTGFGTLGEKHQRVCIATSEAIMNEAIDRMDVALRKLK